MLNFSAKRITQRKWPGHLTVKKKTSLWRNSGAFTSSMHALSAAVSSLLFLLYSVLSAGDSWQEVMLV